jgi:hypothetical protein
MFDSFLKDLVLPYANNSQLKMIHKPALTMA